MGNGAEAPSTGGHHGFRYLGTGIHWHTGSNNFTGGRGNDGFYMTADDWVTDYINGGSGWDTIDYSASKVGVNITLTNGVKGAPSKRHRYGGIPRQLRRQWYDLQLYAAPNCRQIDQHRERNRLGFQRCTERQLGQQRA
jgi:hypothetical protein